MSYKKNETNILVDNDAANLSSDEQYEAYEILSPSAAKSLNLSKPFQQNKIPLNSSASRNSVLKQTQSDRKRKKIKNGATNSSNRKTADAFVEKECDSN